MHKFLPLTLLVLASGCFTVSETPFPSPPRQALPSSATNITLAVRGFATTLTEYTFVDGYHTVFYDGNPYWYGGGVATAHTTSIVPRRQQSDAFLEQAKGRLEEFGFNVMAQTPDYLVEARFSGPVTTAGDVATSIAWVLCSLLTCDHGAQTWQATLKIHDNHTGRLLCTRTFAQKYEVTGFSPIPLFGISYYDRTAPNYMHRWCLTALTERIVAETAAFLAERK